MFPWLTTAASLVPSLEETMLPQLSILRIPVSAPGSTSRQVAPESVEVQMFPRSTIPATLVPSPEQVMPHQSFQVSRPLSALGFPI